MMTLDHWMTKEAVSAERLGKDINLTGQAVRRYRSGERMPDGPTIEKIKERTDGAVDVQDMHDAHLKFLSARQAAE